MAVSSQGPSFSLERVSSCHGQGLGWMALIRPFLGCLLPCHVLTGLTRWERVKGREGTAPARRA